MKINIGISVVAIVLFVVSCSQEDLPLDVQELGLEYYPLQNGQYKIYEVTKTTFLLNTGCIAENSETVNYYLKEAVLDSFQNLENEMSYRVGRYTRENLGDPWNLDSIWTSRRDNRTAIMVENNIPIIKLSFPVEESRKWDGNSLNALDEDQFELINVNKPYFDQETNVTYENTVTVLQEDFDDFIVFKDQRSEIYALNIGLVYKEHKVVDYESESCIGDRIRNAGEEVVMHLIEFGYE